MNQFDKTWRDLNQGQATKIALYPVGKLSRPSLIRRAFKAALLFATTRYSLRLSWQQAAR